METRADEFVTQAREHLTDLEQVLLALEKPSEPAANRERIDRCLRLVHSLKGDAGFLGYTAIRTLANAMETVLEAIRNEEAPASAAAIERLLVARDRLSTLVDDLENSHGADLREILALLKSVEHSPLRVPQAWDIDLRQLDRERSAHLAEFFSTFEGYGEVAVPRLIMASHDLSRELPQGSIRFQAQLASSIPVEDIRRDLGLPAIMMEVQPERALPLSVDLAEWVGASQRPLGRLLADLEGLGRFEDPHLDFGTRDLTTMLPTGPIILRGRLRTPLSQAEVDHRLRLPIRHRVVQPPSAAIANTAAAAPPSAPWPESAPAIADSVPATRALVQEHDKTASLRINVELLDRLMTLIGELTLIRNQSLLACDQDDSPLRPIVQRLDAVTSALQETVLQTRMQPVGNLFGKFPRVVRDLGRQLAKQVEVTVVGRDVEVDKTILEQLSDPLTHLVRNSVDHGIETPEERVAKGKAPVGQITLTAAHEDGQVRIEIRDDGRGIDAQAVRAKALALRLKSESELDRMSPRELLALILLPGFSTARQVTEVSGRGVGMDVVKTNIELLEGSLTIDSQFGAGTAMILRMPLTLAIIPCLIVTVNGERYAIPQRELEGAVCLHPELNGRIEQAFDTEVYRLRDRLLAIVRLREVFDNPQPFTAQTKSEILNKYAASNREPVVTEYIVVVRQGGKRFGLLVDEIRGTEEIVVKPMNVAMKRVDIFTGATIMGDGRVALIADVAGIIQHARVSFETELPVAVPAATRDAVQVHRFLLFEYGPNEQFALPLLQIRRIESLDPGRIEHVGDHEYVTIDGVATRILRLDRVITVSACAPQLAMHLVLPRFTREPTGILISRIVDSESLAVDLQPAPEKEPGVLGTAVVHDRLTLFLDSHYLVEKLLGTALPAVAPVSASRQPRILLADDTPFFREVVGRYLTGAGIAVTSAVHGKDALDKLSEGPFDLIVSDIEMPVMDGWTFAQHVRDRGYRGPLLALSSLSKPENEAKAKACGFDYYEEKLNHDRLIRTVRQMLGGQQRTREDNHE
jgi:two-component system chemotaxis sensor kinase CheA